MGNGKGRLPGTHACLHGGIYRRYRKLHPLKEAVALDAQCNRCIEPWLWTPSRSSARVNRSPPSSVDTQRLVNNHIIRLYEIYQSPEKLYLVLERAPCGSLEEFLFVHGRMNELDAKRVVMQLLDGVAYLHKAGVVHCDLKPANILLSDIDQGSDALSAAGVGCAKSSDGDSVDAPRARPSAPPASLRGLVVKICDFGHTRKVPDCRYYKFTGDINKIPFHMFKHTGTDGFVAPEVLLQEPYGKAADMWCVLCRCVGDESDASCMCTG